MAEPVKISIRIPSSLKHDGKNVAEAFRSYLESEMEDCFPYTNVAVFVEDVPGIEATVTPAPGYTFDDVATREFVADIVKDNLSAFFAAQ